MTREQELLDSAARAIEANSGSRCAKTAAAQLRKGDIPITSLSNIRGDAMRVLQACDSIQRLLNSAQGLG